MYLSAVLIRFFKSFNYDYLRKHNANAKPLPWEDINGAWFPFVRVPLAPDITTVVGANESGKSQLLSAIKKALTGERISRRDFCRYSQFFTVEKGNMRSPDFGLEFAGLEPDDQAILREITGIEGAAAITSFLLLRPNQGDPQVWIRRDEEWKSYAVANPEALAKRSLLPKYFEIDAGVALPDSVPISWLQGAVKQCWTRDVRSKFVRAMEPLQGFLATPETAQAHAPAIASSLVGAFQGYAPQQARERGYGLARDLLFKIARVDKDAIKDLADALAEENEGLVNGILQRINDRLESSLNFPTWWVQDRLFRLSVTARDDDLVFTIGDRTRTEYSFGERSNGLKYFLSYYIQYLAHDFPAGGRELLLMDEPDAYLSSQGQQDLLKIFDAFAHPTEDRPSIQVVYVTHSPFMIDRNHGERIRVLEKGKNDEGTRVVNDASRNHYEPLRSSFGSLVGETAFIGNCNLMVEGIADQVLLAGCSSCYRATGALRAETLDLNRLTIVPAGSASHVPYLVYLARGRDVEKPSVVVMLDSDTEGVEAKKKLLRHPYKGGQLIKPSSIVMIADLEGRVALPAGKRLVEMEDLVPPLLAVAGVRSYLQQVTQATSPQLAAITAEETEAAWIGEKTLFDALEEVVRRHVAECDKVDKLGFARAIVASVAATPEDPQLSTPLLAFRRNMLTLIAAIVRQQRDLEREADEERVAQRIERAIKAFLRDHPTSCPREEAMLLLDDMDAMAGAGPEADQMRFQLQQVRTKHELATPSAGPVEDFDGFVTGLRRIRYAPTNAAQDSHPEAPR